jgi:hypothetical protein
MTLKFSDRLYECLTPAQALKHNEAFSLLRLRPNTWLSLEAIDDTIAAGPRLTHYPDQWVDTLHAMYSQPASQFSISICVELRGTPRALKTEQGVVVKTELDDVPGVVIACTAHHDSARVRRVCEGPPSRLVRAAIRDAEASGFAGRRIVELLYRQVEVQSVEDVVQVVHAASNDGSGRLGLSTNAIQKVEANAHQTAVQDAVDRGLVYAVPGYWAQRRAAEPKRKQNRTEEGGDTGEADAYLAGDLNVDSLSEIHGGLQADFAAWHRTAPVHFSYTRTVDGVVMEEEGLPSVLKVDGNPITIRVKRIGGGRFSRDVLVTISIILPKGVPKSAVTLTPAYVELSSSCDDVETLELKAESETKGSLHVKVSDAGGPDHVSGTSNAHATESTRTFAASKSFQVPWEPRKPVMLFHKATVADNVFRDFAINVSPAGNTDAAADAAVAHLLSPSPALFAALAKRLPSAAEVAATEARLFENVPAGGLGGLGRAGEDELTSSSSSDGDDPRESEKQRAYEHKFLSNRHMFSLGVDVSKPYEPEPDPTTTVLELIGGARKRPR